MSSFAKDVAVWIYHERQEAALCGQHALNNLVQSPAFSPGQLADLAQELDQVELRHLANHNEGGTRSPEYQSRLREGSHHVDERGNFSIEVLRAALQQRYQLELPNLLEEGALQDDDVTAVQGFICNRSDHWFAIRKIGGNYWNLNSTKEKPEFISDFRLEAEIQALQQEGYQVFFAKDLPTSGNHRAGNDSFWWNESDLLGNGATQTKDPWENVGSGNRLDGKSTGAAKRQEELVLTEEEQMQMALQASLEQGSASVAAEPAEGTKGAVKISFRLPDGKRVVRRFLETDRVSSIYAFVESECGVPTFQSLELRCGFPPKDLAPLKQTTIQQAHLAGEMITGRVV